MIKELTVESVPGGVRVRLPRDIDHHSAKYMREEIDTAMAKLMPKRLILDFSDVAFMDSSGVGLVMGRVEGSKRYGGVVELTGLSDGIMRLMRICGVDKLEEVYIK